MFTTRIDQRVFSDASWWHWALTVPLLAAHLAGLVGALAAAIVLCAAMALYYWRTLGLVRPMPVQVRLAYLALLVIGAAPGLGWIHWVQVTGTSAVATIGYCPLVRLLTLLPWNRRESLTRPFLTSLAFAPSSGGLWNWTSDEAAAPVACSCRAVNRLPPNDVTCAG